MTFDRLIILISFNPSLQTTFRTFEYSTSFSVGCIIFKIVLYSTYFVILTFMFGHTDIIKKRKTGVLNFQGCKLIVPYCVSYIFHRKFDKKNSYVTLLSSFGLSYLHTLYHAATDTTPTKPLHYKNDYLETDAYDEFHSLFMKDVKLFNTVSSCSEYLGKNKNIKIITPEYFENNINKFYVYFISKYSLAYKIGTNFLYGKTIGKYDSSTLRFYTRNLITKNITTSSYDYDPKTKMWKTKDSKLSKYYFEYKSEFSKVFGCMEYLDNKLLSIDLNSVEEI